MARRYNQPGRPEGSKNVEREVVAFFPPTCPNCGSTRRAPYRVGPVAEHHFSGIFFGQKYNRIVWRNTECLDCGQAIRVKEFSFDPSLEDVDDHTEEDQRNYADHMEAERIRIQKSAEISESSV